jgi:hypothetical protein
METKKKNAVRFVVAKSRNYHNGEYHQEWRISRREELGGGLVATKPVADVFGGRRHAEWVAEAMNVHARKGKK